MRDVKTTSKQKTRSRIASTTSHPTEYNRPPTVHDHLVSLLPRLASGRSTCPAWPADVFAVAASLLTRGGAYAAILKQWPISERGSTWVAKARSVGAQWRNAWSSPPPDVIDHWNRVINARRVKLQEISSTPILLESLISLVAFSDEACLKVGIPITYRSLKGRELEFQLRADELLEPSDFGSTLCREIHPNRLRVLPKMHTPQTGMTIRSLSLNLGLVVSDEIVPKWHVLLQPINDTRFNVLYVPWPFEVADRALKPCKRNPHELDNMPSRFDFFTYQPRKLGNPANYLRKLLEAEELSGKKIHAVVLPELAVTPTEYEALQRLTRSRDMILIAGVRVKPETEQYSRNEVRFSAPGHQTLVQQKHHRWKLDESQIERYRLERSLDPRKDWWEHIDISSREFTFFAIGDGMVISALICEDLARPDPVGDMVRAVGPNLVIALLLDGPQIASRWPGRYAASLANDPGSSVLSVTSQGMSFRSRPAKKQKNRKRSLALWHSPSNDWREINIAPGAGAIFLSFEKKRKKEYVADGRDDAEQSVFLELRNRFSVRIPASNQSA